MRGSLALPARPWPPSPVHPNCMFSPLADRLLTWYSNHARRLPWRGHSDPYAVWISEIMLQQTRVETVAPYFERWMERFPTVERLSAASLDQVLAAWEGLGYYSRARALHRAAQILMAEFGGQLPAEVEALRRLPGIGRYTAAAVASIAFGIDAAALDGNIRRVLARVYNVAEPARSPAGEKRLWALAEENLPPGRAGDYNQALMDLGALVCTPHKPDCPICPLAELCAARALGVQDERPVAVPKRQTPHYLVAAAVIWRQGRVLIARRPEEGLLGGLWEFPGGKIEAGEDFPTGLRREIQEELEASIEVGAEVGVYRHAYTHFRVTLHAFHCGLVEGEPRPVEASEIRWALPEELVSFPMGKIDRMISGKIGGVVG